MLPIGSITTRYQITLEVADQPGVLARIASLFSEHEVSVETLVQSVGQGGSGAGAGSSPAPLVIGTHAATEASLAATVAAVAHSDAVAAVTSVLRVEGA